MSYIKQKWYKPKTLNMKILVTLLLLLFIRLCSNIPLPFINQEYLKVMFDGKDSAFALINAFSGGAFTNMTFMAVGVTPYITSSIILQLLTITFPKLKEIRDDGATGKKKWEMVQIIVSIILAIIQSIGIAVTFGQQGLLNNFNFGYVCLNTLCWTLGSCLTIAVGEFITRNTIGNGVSLILATNIIASLPSDIMNFYTIYIKNRTNNVNMVISCVLFILVVLALIIATVVLNDAKKEIPVTYSKTVNGSGGKVNSTIPIKLNTAGVLPIIFTSTLFSLPMMFLSNVNNKVVQEIVYITSSNYWFDLTHWWRTIGLVLYGLLVIGFAYFYTAIQFNTFEIANKLKKQGAVIPGVRPGKPTVDYLDDKVKYLTLYGAIFLFLLTQIPTVICGLTSLSSLSFGGTSIIIVVGVIQETAMIIRSEKLAKTYEVKTSKTFLGMSNDVVRRKGVM